MISEIIDVPFPLAASRRLMSFLTFQISMFFSASFAAGSDMMSKRVLQPPEVGEGEFEIMCVTKSLMYSRSDAATFRVVLVVDCGVVGRQVQIMWDAPKRA